MAKPNKQVQIDFIIACLRLGDERGKVLAKFVKKWQSPTRTIDRLLKIAKEQHAVEQESIKEALLNTSTELAAESLKLNIMSANDRKVYLTKVLNGEIKIKKPFAIGGKIMEYPSEPDHADRLKALAELNKMEGEYAPTKTEGKIEVFQAPQIILNK